MAGFCRFVEHDHRLLVYLYVLQVISHWYVSCIIVGVCYENAVYSGVGGGESVGEYNFKSVGDNTTIYPLAKIVGAENIEIGSNVIIDDFVFIVASGPLYIGNYVHIASFTSITGGGECCLEDFSGLSSGVRVITGSDDFLGRSLTNPTVPDEFRSVNRSRVIIKAHAIIGANSVIFPGVTVGVGAAVGAASVVRKDLQSWGVYTGTPAKRIRPRRQDRIEKYEQKLYEAYGRPPRSFRNILL